MVIITVILLAVSVMGLVFMTIAIDANVDSDKRS